MNNPIDNIIWLDINLLKANDYNPNHVYKKEMELLKFSIQKNGWIQPILITKDYVIIDGFHRVTISKVYPEITKDGKIPCCILDISEPERKLLTVRINRAKGSHIALKMGDLIKSLVLDDGISKDEICKQIGATKEEVELLLLDNVFKKKKIDENTKYSNAWIPNK